MSNLTWKEDGMHAVYGLRYESADESGNAGPGFYDVEFSRSGRCNGLPNYAVSFRGKWLGNVSVCVDADGKWGIADAGMDEDQYDTREEAMTRLAEALIDANEINV